MKSPRRSTASVWTAGRKGAATTRKVRAQTELAAVQPSPRGSRASGTVVRLLLRSRGFGVLACVVLLVAYGNTAAYVAGSALPHGSAGVAFGVALVAAVLVIARLEGLALADLGLRRVRLAFDTGVGVAVALLAVGGAIVVLRSPPLLGAPVTYAPLAALDEADLLVRVALTMPLDTAIPEELAFRGLLLATLLRRYGTAAAVALSALAFAAWHVVIVVATVAETDLAGDPFFSALGLAGALLAVFAGGIVFAALRLMTGSLAAPIAAHWGFNAALLVGLRAFA